MELVVFMEPAEVFAVLLVLAAFLTSKRPAPSVLVVESADPLGLLSLIVAIVNLALLIVGLRILMRRTSEENTDREGVEDAGAAEESREVEVRVDLHPVVIPPLHDATETPVTEGTPGEGMIEEGSISEAPVTEGVQGEELEEVHTEMGVVQERTGVLSSEKEAGSRARTETGSTSGSRSSQDTPAPQIDLGTVVVDVHARNPAHELYDEVVEEQQCTICLGKLLDGVKTLDCRHEFHDECLDKWLNEDPTCPNCKKTLLI